MDKIHVMLEDFAFDPVRAHGIDAGLDLRAPMAYTIPPHDSVTIDTGVHVLIPEGFAGILLSKSGLNVKHGLTSEGLIDAGYTGTIIVKLYNNSREYYYVRQGEKISQLVILPVETPDVVFVDRFPETERGSNGFGSSGR